MSSSWDMLLSLAKRDYERGLEYGPCHLQMNQELVERLRQEFKPDTGATQNLIDMRDKLFGRPVLSEFIGIPIMLNNDLGSDTWQLVVNSSREVVESGIVHAEFGTDGTQTQ